MASHIIDIFSIIVEKVKLQKKNVVGYSSLSTTKIWYFVGKDIITSTHKISFQLGIKTSVITLVL